MLVHINKKWLFIAATEVPLGKARDDYAFLIEIGEATFPLDPKVAKQNNPRLSIIQSFPENCRLDYLCDFGIEKLDYQIHPKSYTSYYKDVCHQFLIQTSLIVTAKNGVKFKIEPSEAQWGWLEISMIS